MEVRGFFEGRKVGGGGEFSGKMGERGCGNPRVREGAFYDGVGGGVGVRERNAVSLFLSLVDREINAC